MIRTSLKGEYRGRGAWFQSDGTQGGYDVVLTVEAAAQGLGLSYTHVFDNGDPETRARFDIVPGGPVLFSVLSGGQALGRGYLLEGLLHYTLEMPGNVVEASLITDGAGLRVTGSASRNTAGHAIAWEERLERA